MKENKEREASILRVLRCVCKGCGCFNNQEGEFGRHKKSERIFFTSENKICYTVGATIIIVIITKILNVSLNVSYVMDALKS